MLHFHIHDKKPIPHLEERIEKQKREGGRLILYRRAWSALIVTVTQDRIEHVPPHGSRLTAGIKHSLFTLVLGIWSISAIFGVPILLILNLRGGADVTGQFSETSADPLREQLPDPRQAEKDLVAAQLTFVVLMVILIAVFLYFAL